MNFLECRTIESVCAEVDRRNRGEQNGTIGNFKEFGARQDSQIIKEQKEKQKGA